MSQKELLGKAFRIAGLLESLTPDILPDPMKQDFLDIVCLALKSATEEEIEGAT